MPTPSPLRWRTRAAGLAVLGVLVLAQATAFDSVSVTPDWPPPSEMTDPIPGARLQFGATAYCKGEITRSGVRVRPGIVAADPRVLPLGSIVEVSGVAEPYAGVYSVLDTGPEIQGREIDIYIWSCYEALDFGRRKVDLTVLRLGWHQGNTAPQGR
jgi:3D (Asp-Asp-Asp) domain-containing protein